VQSCPLASNYPGERLTDPVLIEQVKNSATPKEFLRASREFYSEAASNLDGSFDTLKQRLYIFSNELSNLFQ
jgi:hypothetical protein